ncbi:membrane protein [Streptomyces rectiviolaceus]|uniref:Membrane protein n=1 Tax=Streptomyces rectiviolaceus TaxID=332591 RepID=A0ABP6MCY1_9ACTN
MGIESDQLVFDYLSRVGDLAQQRQLPSGTRMRLVSELRNQIDRSRAKTTVDSPAAIRRILDRLGTPEELVEAAGAGGGVGTGAGSTDTTRPAVPTQRTSEPKERERPKRLRRVVPRPRPAAEEPELPEEDHLPSPPHLAGTDELGESGSEPDWWRVDSSPFGPADSVPGFTGGVEIPEILKPPPKKREGEVEEEEGGEAEVDDDEEWEEEEEPGLRARRRIRFPRPAARAADPAAPRFTNPLLLLAAALLTVGAVLGNWLALGGGWLLAYVSRRLSRAEAKWAVIGLPGLSVAAGITWLWGRNEGRWGDPISDGHMSDAMAETWPWVVRGAAVASALYLLWRSQRQRP